jgi:hypothetical protein
MPRRGLRPALAPLVSVAATVVLFLALVPTAHAWTTPNKATTPIIFVHGYSDGLSCPSTDVTMWSPLQGDLVEDGWTSDKRLVGYYSCDTHVSANDWIDLHGSHSVYYNTSPCSPLCATHETGTSGHTSHNRNTDIRHLAYHLAWFIWDNYSQYGRSVQIVAHSMGGLIVRWMLYAEQNNSTIGQGRFPPRLYIQDIYTVSTPHNGTSYAFLGVFYQTEEMQTGSSFLNALNGSASGRNPQATNGTDWTTMGNYPADTDLVVTAGSATHMDGGHKVLFDGPTQYSHGGSLNDTSETWDAHAYRCDYCPATVSVGNGNYTHYTNLPHNDAYVDQALYHNSSSWPS